MFTPGDHRSPELYTVNKDLGTRGHWVRLYNSTERGHNIIQTAVQLLAKKMLQKH